MVTYLYLFGYYFSYFHYSLQVDFFEKFHNQLLYCVNLLEGVISITITNLLHILLS